MSMPGSDELIREVENIDVLNVTNTMEVGDDIRLFNIDFENGRSLRIQEIIVTKR